jgi:hypothetical protein
MSNDFDSCQIKECPHRRPSGNCFVERNPNRCPLSVKVMKMSDFIGALNSKIESLQCYHLKRRVIDGEYTFKRIIGNFFIGTRKVQNDRL